jgi:adenylate cyclase
MAELVTKLNQYGAKVIAFDMVFAEEDRTSPATIAKGLPQEEAYADIKDKLSHLPDHDNIFATAIKEAGNVVTGFSAARPEDTHRLPYQKIKPTFLLRDKTPFFENTFTPRGLVTNLPEFSSMAAGTGSFMATPDVDGIIRQVSLFNVYPAFETAQQKPNLYPMLGLEALRTYINPKSRFMVRALKDGGTFDPNYIIQMADIKVPIESDSKLWVYYRDIEPEEYISAQEILKNDVSLALQEKIKDKIIFVGTSAEGLRDIRATPLDIFIPGVEVHVNMAEQILQGKYLKRPNLIVGVEAGIIALAGFLIIILAPFINALWLGLFTVLLIGGLFYGALQAYVTQGLLLDPVYPSLSIFLLFLVSSLLSYLRSEVDRQQVKTAFGHYISPDFMEELTNNPDKLKLGGEVRELTVLFSDIRSFTKISEKLSPEELIQLMNDFLTPMSDLVMEARGTIDKYMGDAMMAFWNAPLDDPDHARQACLTALKMNEALIPVNDEIKKRATEQGVEPLLLSAGIGINTGPCSVGNMGSKQRFAYSALGDAVNLASRLEGQTKTYGVSTLVGEDTYQHVSDLAMLELDLIKVIGREEPVKVYTLIGDEVHAQTAAFKKWQAVHNDMLVAYRGADVSAAVQSCQQAKDLATPEMQKFYDIYQARIDDLKKNPPPKDWDGVFIAKSK